MPPQRAPTSSSLMRPFVVLALPGMYLLYKYNQYRQQQMETARRRVTERELMHLNTKIEDEACAGCRRALVDIPKPVDDECPLPTEKRKKPGILYKMKLKMIDGGANFGTPFWKKKPKKAKKKKELPARVEPQPTLVQVPEPRPGVHVAVLGAEGAVGQYLALLLKQCLAVKKLKLYEATCPTHNRDAYVVAQDLKHIDTNCMVQAYSCGSCELELCVENSDIVVMLNLPEVNMCLPYYQRFTMQAPHVKMYAEAISRLCPRAFIIVATSPIDCMTPLISEVMKGNGYYNNRKLIGSMALQEMRASTLAGNALCLDPNITRVPCVGGTEGEALVPLFSKALEKFEFTEQIMECMTNTLRDTSCKVKDCVVSEAYALARLVNTIAHALTCMHVPKISAFVEPDPCSTMTPTRFMANKVDINRTGIICNYGLPLLSERETFRMDRALLEINYKINLARMWYSQNSCAFKHNNRVQKYFYSPREYAEFERCRI